MTPICIIIFFFFSSLFHRLQLFSLLRCKPPLPPPPTGHTVWKVLAQGVRPASALHAQAGCEGQRPAPAARLAPAGETEHAAGGQTAGRPLIQRLPPVDTGQGYHNCDVTQLHAWWDEEGISNLQLAVTKNSRIFTERQEKYSFVAIQGCPTDLYLLNKSPRVAILNCSATINSLIENPVKKSTLQQWSKIKFFFG